MCIVLCFKSNIVLQYITTMWRNKCINLTVCVFKIIFVSSRMLQYATISIFEGGLEVIKENLSTYFLKQSGNPKIKMIKTGKMYIT